MSPLGEMASPSHPSATGTLPVTRPEEVSMTETVGGRYPPLSTSRYLPSALPAQREPGNEHFKIHLRVHRGVRTLEQVHRVAGFEDVFAEIAAAKFPVRRIGRAAQHPHAFSRAALDR